MPLSDNMKGAALMAASMAGFVLNDTCMKLVGPDIGLFQSIFLRGLFATALIGAFALSSGAFRRLPGRRDGWLISLRSVAEIASTLAFITALFSMPLANLTAILQILPLTMALAAAVFLGEPIGRRRIGAILAGFVGVLVIVRPGVEGFNSYALLGLLTVVFVTVRDLSVRRFSPQVSSLFVAFVTAAVITLAGGIGALIGGTWQPMTGAQTGTLMLAALFLFVGYYTSVAAMRVGEVSVVATYRYTILIWAVFLGWFAFGDLPDIWTVIGMAIIMAAGLFTMWRERQLRAAAVIDREDTAMPRPTAAPLPRE